MAALAYLVYLWSPFYVSTTAITTSDSFAALLTFIFLFLYVLPFVLFGVIYPWFRNNTIANRIYLSSLLTTFTVLISNLFTHNLAFHLYDNPLVIQIVDISGVSLLFWVIVFVNLSLSHAIHNMWIYKNRLKLLPKQFYFGLMGLMTAGIAVLGYGYYQLNINNINQQDNISVASVQANLGSRLSPLAIVRDSKQGQALSYIEMTRELMQEHKLIDLIVWPENGMPVDCNNTYIKNKISLFVKEIKTPLIYQCNECKVSDGSSQCYNQSRFLDPDGELVNQYNKHNLFPLVEHIPKKFSYEFIVDKLKITEDYMVGKKVSLFESTKARIIPSICFDAHSIDLILAGIELGGNLLVIQSNNRIFKQSFIGLFDLSINVMNSVSLRMPTVKVNNSGYGAFISESGMVLDGSITPVYQKTSSTHVLNLNSRYSVFRSIGDWFIYLSGIISICGFIYKNKLKA